jgi:protein-S-isoprenylcysteine O-methyltransferase Ste14
MMRAATHRIGQALLLWVAVGGPILLWWPAALRLPALWAVVALGVLTNALQPSYRLRGAVRTPPDRGTFHQIMLTVYGTQAAALVELVLRRPSALPFDALGGGALLVMGAGLALRTWAVATLGGWFTLQVGVQPAQRLVRTGPYRLIRHPSYTGAFVALTASAVLLRAWVTVVLGAIALYAAFRRRIRHEERLLATVLPGYRRYMARTGGLVPARIRSRPTVATRRARPRRG